jgi:hypothetical protein
MPARGLEFLAEPKQANAVAVHGLVATTTTAGEQKAARAFLTCMQTTF